MGWLRGILAVLVLYYLVFGVCGQENASKRESPCRGCVVNDRCLQVGVRLEGQYCWVDGQLQPQKQQGEKCENGFECKENQCNAGLCQEKQAKGFYDELKDWLFHIFRIVLIKRI